MNIICIGSSEVKHVLDQINSIYLDMYHDPSKEGRVQNGLDLYLWQGGKNLVDELVEDLSSSICDYFNFLFHSVEIPINSL